MQVELHALEVMEAEGILEAAKIEGCKPEVVQVEGHRLEAVQPESRRLEAMQVDLNRAIEILRGLIPPTKR